MLCFLMMPMAHSKTIMRFAIQVPTDHYLGLHVLQFKEEVEMKSKGEINVIILDYANYKQAKKNKKTNEEGEEKNQLPPFYRDNEIIDAVASGDVEIGLVSLNRFGSIFPSTDIFNQPFIFDTDKKLKKALEKGSLIRENIESAIKKTGYKVLWWQPYGSAIIVSKGKSVQKPEDIKGKEVRVFGKTMGNLVLVAGGKPVLIPNSRQHFSYKHRKVEMGMTTVNDIERKKIWEVMDTISITNHASLQFLSLANSDWWLSLSSGVRSIIMEAAEKVEIDSRKRLKVLEENAYLSAMKNGMNIVILSDEDRELWKFKSIPVYQNYIEISGEDGQLIFDEANNY